MSIRSNADYEEAEQEGEIELVLVAIEYTGPRSYYSSNAMRNQGGYPSLGGFQQGQTQLVRINSANLGWWESHANFVVHYDEVTIAETLLESNYIPPQVLDRTEYRDLLMEQLDLEAFTGEDDLREQLLEVAGLEEEELEEDPRGDTSRADRLQEEHSRSVLIKVAGSFDDVDEFLEEVDADQINHAKNTELAGFLASKDAATVKRKLNQAEMGNEL